MKRLILVLIALSSAVSAMNGMQQIGYGTKARGMGGAAIALPQDAFTIANNPAGLVFVGSRVDVGLHWLHQNARIRAFFEPNASEQYYSRRNLIWPELAGSWHFRCRESFGLALYSYGGFETLYNPVVLAFGTQHSGMEFKSFIIAPSWSRYLGCHMAIGVAVNVAFAWVKVRGLEAIIGLPPDATVSASECPAYATNRRPDHEEGLSLRFGWMWRWRHWLAAGLTYQTPTWINRFKCYKGFIPGRGDLKLPAQLGGGIAWKPHCRLTLASDVEWIFWRSSAQFRNPDRVGTLLGAPDGPGFGWRDRLVVKVGGSFAAAPCLILRAGWNWSQIPFNRRQAAFNFLNGCGVEHHVTIGGTYYFRRNELSLCYVRGFHKTTHLDAVQFGPFESLRGRQYSVGASYARKF